MNKEEAQNIPELFPGMVGRLYEESAKDAIQAYTWLITTLYDQGYVILSPKEVKFYEKRLNER